MLQVSHLSVEVGGRVVLSDASFALYPGDKVGLVGRNGAGKTSLLKVIGGAAPAIGGRVTFRGALGYLPQDPRTRAHPDRVSALEHVISGRSLDVAARRLERLRLDLERDASKRNVERFSAAEDRYRVDGGYAAEGDARRIVAGLGLDPARIDLPLQVLSGGERRRVELGRILFGGSDLLLLDEPTNHLDNDARAWLMRFLRSYRGALLVVSHDLALLDAAITRVLHLDGAELTSYKGTYSEYRTARARDEERAARLARRRESEIARLGSRADSMRGQTQRRARTAAALDSRVARLRTQRVDGPGRSRAMRLRLPEPPRSGDLVVRISGLAKGYGGDPVFDDLSFEVGRGERLLVMGLNGAGKTSLLRVLAGITSADEGSVTLGASVSLGYYAQEHEGITAGRDVLSHMRSASDLPDQQLRSILGMFGLTGEAAFQDAGTLSGGEKTKLALAHLVAGRHNLLLLDEPTNNLDPDSLAAVSDALSGWHGAMVVVSHDVAFVDRLQPDRVLYMPEGELGHWSDELADLVALS